MINVMIMVRRKGKFKVYFYDSDYFAPVCHWSADSTSLIVEIGASPTFDGNTLVQVPVHQWRYPALFLMYSLPMPWFDLFALQLDTRNSLASNAAIRAQPTPRVLVRALNESHKAVFQLWSNCTSRFQRLSMQANFMTPIRTASLTQMNRYIQNRWMQLCSWGMNS